MKKLAALVVSLVPVTAFAHPGHGTTDPSSVKHYFVEPLHVLLVLAAVIGVVAVWGWTKARADRRPS